MEVLVPSSGQASRQTMMASHIRRTERSAFHPGPELSYQHGRIHTYRDVWSAAGLQGKSLEEESLRQCIRPFCGELFLLAMMRYAACCPQKPLGHVRAHSVNRFQARRSDCSFIFTRPMQTLVGELGSIFCYVCLCRCSAGSRFVILTT